MNTKAVAIAIIAVLVVAGGGGATHLLLKDKGGDDTASWDGAHIADFSNYKYIGAGTTGASGDGTSAGYKLVGATLSNECGIVDLVSPDGKKID